MKRIFALIAVVVIVALSAFVAGWSWDDAFGSTPTATGFFDGN